ncbi:MAG: ABC transporter ATP-binding protein [Planctomycetota bacterium]
MPDVIEVENVAKDFHLGRIVVHALRGVSLSVKAGEFMAIVGPSGSGKSTLLNLIGCIERPTSGRVLVDGRDVSALSGDRQADLRARKMGYVFQTFNLLPVLTAEENVEYPLHLQGIPRRERRERVRALMAEVGLESVAFHKPAELSGGQRQRVAVARALVGRPAIVLADEPSANLDHKTGVEILELMRRLNEKTKTTFIFSTHDPKVMSIAQRVVELSDGEIVKKG